MDQAEEVNVLALLGVLAMVSFAGCLGGDAPSSSTSDDPQPGDHPLGEAYPSPMVIHHNGRYTAWVQTSPRAHDATLPGIDAPNGQTTWNHTYFYLESATDNQTPVTITATWSAHQAFSEELNLTLHEWDPYTREAAHQGTSPVILDHILDPEKTYRVELHLPQAPATKLDIAWNITVQGAVENVPREEVEMGTGSGGGLLIPAAGPASMLFGGIAAALIGARWLKS